MKEDREARELDGKMMMRNSKRKKQKLVNQTSKRIPTFINITAQFSFR